MQSLLKNNAVCLYFMTNKYVFGSILNTKLKKHSANY